MIRVSNVVGVLVLGGSLCVHLLGLTAIEDVAPVQLEGGEEQLVPRLGNSFRDLARGSTATPPPRSSALAPPNPRPVPALPPVTDSRHIATTKPTISEISKTSVSAAFYAQNPLVPIAPTSAPATGVPPAGKIAVKSTSAAVKQLHTVQPSTIAASPPSPALRPVNPNRQKLVATTPKVQKKPADRGSPPVKGGAQAEQRGTTNGQARATATRSNIASTNRRQAAGNSAIANYKGKIWRKIQRNKPRTNLRGAAHVALSISASGRLKSVRLVRSSGSAQLDRLILRGIRKAAPFPASPTGETQNFTFAVKSGGNSG